MGKDWRSKAGCLGMGCQYRVRTSRRSSFETRPDYPDLSATLMRWQLVVPEAVSIWIPKLAFYVD